tara:strand:+ start:421 stop:1041 length:621 start_codon:yes stop_codon:yes gene_type:complete
MALVKYNNNSISAVTSTALAEGSLVPIKTLTASGSASLSFVHGSSDVVLDSTYPIYFFEFISLHAETDNKKFEFQASTDGGSSYGITITSTAFYSSNDETDGSTALAYYSSQDLAQSTSFQPLISFSGNDNDQCVSGHMKLFNPSSTTFVKHFISRGNSAGAGDYSQEMYVSGYYNTTSAINAVKFQMSSGNIDSGKIKLYGIKDS